jgi:hypothetical protein
MGYLGKHSNATTWVNKISSLVDRLATRLEDCKGKSNFVQRPPYATGETPKLPRQ